MSIGLIGRKVGMTQVFAEDGTMVPVSVVAVEPNTVTLLRTEERDGYTAVQVGAGTARKTTKPRAGQLKDLPKVRDVREFRVDDVAEPYIRRRAQRHLENRKHGLDLFTELFYALGFDDRLDKLAGQVGQDVADIIDLQAERQKVARAKGILLEGTSGNETVVEESPDVIHTSAKDLH